MSTTGRLRTYRTDIDGLRAVAVMLVVFNHLRFPHMTGGYVGVDVFFVISGYLIGSSMIAEYSEGRFSLAAFYERRVRRILPALLVMLGVVSAVAYLLLMPAAFASYGVTMIAALFSVSNFLFWKQAGYFDAPSAAKPLLHTWSLAVEEQFYLLLPLLLAVVYRWMPRRVRASIACIMVASFAASLWFVHRDPTTAFFWSPLRAWELLAGVLISQMSVRPMESRLGREAAALTGLTLILVPGVWYDSFTPFPGFSALAPCLGAALLLLAGAGGSSATGVLLSSPPFRFVGMISYSLYLWHWPILVLQNTGFLLSTKPSMLGRTKLLLLAVSLVVATLSWRFVEEPFRRGPLRLERRALFVWSGAATCGLIVVGAWIVYADGAPSRFSDRVLQIAKFESISDPPLWRSGTCFISPPNTVAANFKPDQCLNFMPGKKNYLLYGDSTAAELLPGLVAAFPGIHFQQATSAGCVPLPSEFQAAAGFGLFGRNCIEMWHYVHETYLPTHAPDAVLLAARWGDGDLRDLGEELDRFRRAGVQVILIGPEIAFDVPLPELLIESVRRRERGGQRSIDLSEHMLVLRKKVDAEMQTLAAQTWHVRYVSRFQDLCEAQVEMVAKAQVETAGGCPVVTATGAPLIFDEHHLTTSGAMQLAGTMLERHQLP